jgi:hypothetical protein
MKFARTLAVISSLCAMFAPSMPAATFATLDCGPAGSPMLSLPIEAFTFEYSPTAGSLGFFTVYTDIANLRTLILTLGPKPTFSTCSVSSNSIGTSVSDATLENVTAAGAGPGVTSAKVGVAYAGATFSFTGIAIDNPLPSATSRPATLTPEERKKAVDAFQALGLALPSTSK